MTHAAVQVASDRDNLAEDCAGLADEVTTGHALCMGCLRVPRVQCEVEALRRQLAGMGNMVSAGEMAQLRSRVAAMRAQVLYGVVWRLALVAEHRHMLRLTSGFVGWRSVLDSEKKLEYYEGWYKTRMEGAMRLLKRSMAILTGRSHERHLLLVWKVRCDTYAEAMRAAQRRMAGLPPLEPAQWEWENEDGEWEGHGKGVSALLEEALLSGAHCRSGLGCLWRPRVAEPAIGLRENWAVP